MDIYEFGEYSFENFTLINPLVVDDNTYLTPLHEHTHRVLSVQSIVGELLWSLRKMTKLAYINHEKDYDIMNLMTKTLVKYSLKTQEGTAVFVECIIILEQKGINDCKEYIENLRLFNRKYYNFFRPLKFIFDKVLKEKNSKLRLLTMRGMLVLAIDALNAEIYNTDIEVWREKKTLKKYFSYADNAKKFLPDTRFINSLNWIMKKNTTCCKELIFLIQERLNDNHFAARTKDSTLRELNNTKNFLLSLFASSTNIQFYRRQLDSIYVKEEDANKLFLQQIPSTFNKNKIDRMDLKKEREDFLRLINNNYSMIFLLGDLYLVRKVILSYCGLNSKSINDGILGNLLPIKHDSMDKITKEFIVGYDLKKEKIISGILNKEDIEYILKEIQNYSETKGILLVSFSDFDFCNNCIINHEEIDRTTYVYCDNTYEKIQIYFDMWSKKKIYCRFMQFGDMIVLLIRFAPKCIFILPMTSSVGNEAIGDIKQNWPNIIFAEKNETSTYDDFILKNDDDIMVINIIINSLFFI